ncbi:MAG TPA: DUF4383 domain-containing protein [Phycisphaerales bacterium]|nr:DUF4383 domain-containing protein [Phycisphaerales bacterium]
MADRALSLNAKSPANTICIVLGVVFIIVAIWGFITGDRVLIFHVNPMHNLVHLVSGIAALACGLRSVNAARTFCFVFAGVYGLVALLGFAGVQPVIDLLHLNQADNWLHLFLTLAFLGGGLASLPKSSPAGPNSPPRHA